MRNLFLLFLKIPLSAIVQKKRSEVKSTFAKKKSTPKRDPSVRRSVLKNNFPIAAIGASAGGLEAMKELLQHLPANTGMAFIYVQHLSPHHESILASLLAKSTSMKVQQIKNRMPILPNNVYVMPPDKEMNVMDGHIKLSNRPKEPVVNLPIDKFFSSLAEKHKENVIGIILSGSASDGTRGMKAIKHEGGLTFAQDDTAKFSGMPKSAIAADAVDFILSPKKIALELARLSKHPFLNPPSGGRGAGAKAKGEEEIEDNHPGLKNIIDILHKATGVDFNQYKITTIKRRILRRMLLYKINSLKEYAKLLTKKNEETEILYQDLLINVTCFFRDTETYQYLKTTLLPRLLKSKKHNEPLRIWVAACSSGEEAYSIAMTLLEIQDSKFTGIPVQIFATDLDTNAISKARRGIYTKQEVENVSSKRLQRFFIKADGGYRISKTVREICVFASHNILSDPPFAHVDLISCCNLFIYLDAATQKKALAIFHYALNADGYLMLGKSETIGSDTQFFTGFSKKFKIYSRKKNSDTRIMPALTPLAKAAYRPEENLPAVRNKKMPATTNVLDNAIDAVLLSDYVPPSVVINYQLEIVQFRGSTDSYLSHQPGKATLNILKITRPEIAFELRNAISKAIKTKQIVRKSGIEMKVNSSLRSVSIEVAPLKIQWNEPLLLIVFSDQQQVEIFAHHAKGGKSISLAKDRRIKKLEEELAATRADMNFFVQEQEAYAEELQSAKEEVVSSNEELQSVNEELETSKEEIESANEELTTINQELQTRNELLNEAYEYSDTIIRFSPIPMIVFNKDFLVKSANISFYKKFKVTESKTEGRLLYDLGNKQWDIPALHTLLEDIIPKNAHFENFEVKHNFPTIGEKVMLLNAQRIIQEKDHEQLIVLAIADITEVRAKEIKLQVKEKEAMEEQLDAEKKIARVVRESEMNLKNILEGLPQLAWRSQPDGMHNYFNRRWYEFTGQTEEEAMNEGWTDALHPDDRAWIDPLWKKNLENKTRIEAEYRLRAKDGSYHWFLTRAEPHFDADNNVTAYIGTSTNIDDAKRIQHELMQNQKRRKDFIKMASHELKTPITTIKGYVQLMLSMLKDEENGKLSPLLVKSSMVTIDKQVSRLVRSMSELLDLSRLEGGQLELAKELFSLNELVIESVQDVVYTNIRHTINISHDFECSVNADRDRIGQVISNLLTNAIKYSPNADRIDVRIYQQAKNLAAVSIKDHGIGIDREDLGKIFEQFYRAEGTSEQTYPGFGLGLFISSEIIQRHNGTISVESEKENGSVFTFTLPATPKNKN